MQKMQLTIGFVTFGIPFHGDSIKEHSLGGSETAMLYMAECLAARGHDVHVFCNCPKPGRYGNVQYYDAGASIQEMWGILEFDVLVVSRVFNVLANNFKAKQVVLWQHDMPHENKNEFMAFMFRCDQIFLMSEFQKAEYTKKFPEIESLIHVTKNGVDWELLRQSVKTAPARSDKRVIFASRPERGLDYMLGEIWPRLHEADPELELVVSSYDIFGTPVPEETRQLYLKCAQLQKELPNIRNFGNLKKEEYYQLLATCTLMLYPTWFPEISCINAMESMACGAPFISTDKFALKETAAQGAVLIDKPWATSEYTEEFVLKTLNLLRDEHYRQGLREEGMHWVENNYQWKQIAEDWETQFIKLFEERAKDKVGVLRNLARHDDHVAATEYIKRNPDAVDETCPTIPPLVDYFWRPTGIYSSAGKLIPKYADALGKMHVAASRSGPPKRVLDICCGQGQFCAAIKRVFPDAHVVGVDYDEDSIKRALERQKAGSEGYEGCDFYEAEDYFKQDVHACDIVFCGDVLQRTGDPHVFLEKLKRLCTPDGHVIITVPQGPWRPLWTNDPDPNVQGHIHHFEMSDIKEIFGEQEEFGLGYTPLGGNYANEMCGNWIIVFKNSDTPFGYISYDRKFLTTPPWERISCAMIVRDVEDDLGRCCKSVRPYVDHMVIVDTGSKDDTVEIAKRFADDVQEIEWPEDFSAARNVSLKGTKGEWVFWIDSDEKLLGGKDLRKYTRSRVFNGFVVRQCHLMLDYNSKPDVPIRLFRKKPTYQFYGVVHEHCEDGMDNPISPAMLCPDVNIAHFGYIVEEQRRFKCAKRNLALLAKDRRVNPDRKLGDVLMMRDYINLSNWDIEAAQQITPDAVSWLRACVVIYNEKVEASDRVYQLAFPIYQQALQLLGRWKVPVSDDQVAPPFEAALVLAASHGGLSLPPDAQATPERRWFGTLEEHAQYLAEKREELQGRMEPKEEVADARRA
jgi:glycosyltransferase involved in cell wall biosynthesis/SAM-dependent methyltransferase